MSEARRQVVLVVDDDRHVQAAVAHLLGEEGFQVHGARDAFQARGMVERLSPDLVILDRRLPDGDGLDLCRELRADPRRAGLPILFLSAKGTVPERVAGIALGADDYLPKPFANEELLVRVKALLRRSGPAAQAPRALRSGEIELEPETQRAAVAGRKVRLAGKEFELLQAFLESGGRVLTRAYLLERVWGYERSAVVGDRAVDTAVSALRGKLGRAGRRLVSVRGRGYRLEEPEGR